MTHARRVTATTFPSTAPPFVQTAVHLVASKVTGDEPDVGEQGIVAP